MFTFISLEVRVLRFLATITDVTPAGAATRVVSGMKIGSLMIEPPRNMPLSLAEAVLAAKNAADRKIPLMTLSGTCNLVLQCLR